MGRADRAHNTFANTRDELCEGTGTNVFVVVGGRLLTELESAARQRGVGALSLSVDITNPAVDLYRRHGYREVAQRAGSYVMVLSLTVGGPEG